MKSGLPNVRPKSGKLSTACFQRIIPYAESSRIRTTRLRLRRTAVSISCEFIMKPPSPQTASTRRSGCSIAAIMADGSPAPHRRQRVVQQQRVRDIGSVVPRKPDFVHPVIQGDDTVLRNDLSYIVDDPLRRRWPTILGR